MSNQEEKNSVLKPVGKVLCVAQTATGGMIGIAQVDINLAPVGTELFVQPSEGRLKLEIEVANENALHWQKALRDANERITELRNEKYRLRDLLHATHILIEHSDFSCVEETALQMHDLQKLIKGALG